MELEISMISYSEAKRNLMFRVEALEETIKFLRENTYYEQNCKNCNSIMKIRVSKPSGKDKNYCSKSCIMKADYKKKAKKNV